MYHLDDSIKLVKGIGDKKSKQLEKVGIRTVGDLIMYFPRSYEDRRRISKLSELKEGERANALVRVLERPVTRRAGARKNITKVLVSDETEKVYLSWFNKSYISKELSIGDMLKVSGPVSKMGIFKEISNPIYSKDIESDDKIGGIVPVYGLTEGLKNGQVTRYMREVVDNIEAVELIPSYIRERQGLMSFKEAIAEMHFPSKRQTYKLARDTLAFGELLKLQLGLLYLKSNKSKSIRGISFKAGGRVERLLSTLPFKLTGAQERAIGEIQRDMESLRQMNRLVQGDVGSGKTIVAMVALLKAVDSGYQGAMMAPTEILAKQHYESLQETLSELDVGLGLLVSSLSAREKRDVLERLRLGEIDILLGTHALIEDYVDFKRLGIVITDEQHRFGVNQRARLSQKGREPDVLVMTATPIPRTLALMLYGDLDISVIDELPPGRKKIKTYARESSARDRIYDFVEQQIEAGRQAYVVCPLVEDSETMNLNSVESVYQELGARYENYSVGLVHGRLKSGEKDAIMENFKDNKINVLVSTTVIEVGVNVPNANIMVIENSERFGLSQLHQLRGRVGRGSYQSYCILINGGKGSVAKERARVMEETRDGFVISEKDLELRGPGEFFGIRQHGLPELKVAKLPRDMEILSRVQSLALDLMEADPELELKENEILKNMVDSMICAKDGLSLN